jgi:hypothetical protein
LAKKLTQVVPSADALRHQRIDTQTATTITAALTWAAPNRRLSRADAAVAKKVAALPDSSFVDRQKPSYVRSLRDELREYAEGIATLQRVKLYIASKVPGITVSLKRDIAVVDLDEHGYHHELILEVKMPSNKADHDGTLAFTYGTFEVSIEVKRGQSRDSIMSRIEARLQRQQERLFPGQVTDTSREFLLHRFRPLTAGERKQRDDLISARETLLWETTED